MGTPRAASAAWWGSRSFWSHWPAVRVVVHRAPSRRRHRVHQAVASLAARRGEEHHGVIRHAGRVVWKCPHIALRKPPSYAPARRTSDANGLDKPVSSTVRRKGRSPLGGAPQGVVAIGVGHYDALIGATAKRESRLSSRPVSFIPAGGSRQRQRMGEPAL